MQLNLAALEQAEVATAPYPYLIVPDFIAGSSLEEARRDFPKLDMVGLFPPDELTFGAGFAALLEQMRGDDLRRTIARKFDVDLSGCATMMTIRGYARERDGRIHRDSNFKLVTVLLYLNETWFPEGGRLRVLRSPDDIEDYAAEIPPDGGLLFAFRCTETAWHGHKPVVGPRRAVMMNYVADSEVCRRELARHRLSAKVKKLKSMFG